MPLFVLQPRGLGSPTEETPNMILAETSTWEDEVARLAVIRDKEDESSTIVIVVYIL